jgi:hypothetical protein
MSLCVTVLWEADTDRDPVTGRFIRQCREFEVTGSATPYIPARIRADPDNSHPAEGGEVEIDEVEEIFFHRRRGKLIKTTESVSSSVLEELGLEGTAIELLEDQARQESHSRDDERDWDTERELRQEREYDRRHGYDD